MISEIRGTARGQIQARLIDLSVGGALLQLFMPLGAGAIHDFALQIDGRTVWVQGEVKRCEPAPGGPGHQVGVEFIGIDPGDQQLLQVYLASRRS
ncbi:MAG TPA: PilZ domain-containing protein [Candidatus Limnocylindrales bacterium]|nr:PilZ domain-containing protein [Candidatus Limnocylindrales bacterium]